MDWEEFRSRCRIDRHRLVDLELRRMRRKGSYLFDLVCLSSSCFIIF